MTDYFNRIHLLSYRVTVGAAKSVNTSLQSWELVVCLYYMNSFSVCRVLSAY